MTERYAELAPERLKAIVHAAGRRSRSGHVACV